MSEFLIEDIKVQNKRTERYSIFYSVAFCLEHEYIAVNVFY